MCNCSVSFCGPNRDHQNLLRLHHDLSSHYGRHRWQRDAQLLRHLSYIHLNTHLQLMPKLRMNGAIFSLPQYASMTCVRKTLSINFNPLNPELNPMCCLLALLGAHHFLHVSRIRVKSLTLRRLRSYIYI